MIKQYFANFMETLRDRSLFKYQERPAEILI